MSSRLTQATRPTTESAIIRLKDGVNVDEHIRAQQNLHNRNGVISHSVTYKWPTRLTNAYAGEFTPEVLAYLSAHDDVEYISDNGPTEEFNIEYQDDAGWGLARIQQVDQISGKTDADLNYSYQYEGSEERGAGVDIYIIDSGIFVEHNDFGGRASWGVVIQDGATKKDSSGHGTHVAGIAGGTRWGVAKGANLIAVKVTDDNNKGRVSDDVRGMDWVLEKAEETGRPSVANISRGSHRFNRFWNERATELVKSGVHVTVSAGNDNKDARNASPASALLVNTVGATNIYDRRYTHVHKKGQPDQYFTGSNYGPCVDFFAPGENITSCALDNKDAYIQKTGTSMSAPLVAGVIATFISLHGNMPPQAMTNIIKTLSVKDKINMTGLDGYTPKLTLNALVRGALHVSTDYSFEAKVADMGVTSPAVFSKDKDTVYPAGNTTIFRKNSILTTTLFDNKQKHGFRNRNDDDDKPSRANILFTIVSAYPFIDAFLFRTGATDGEGESWFSFPDVEDSLREDGELQEGLTSHKVAFKYCLLE